jgi:hypothetical protein
LTYKDIAHVVEKAHGRELQYQLISPVQADLLSKFCGLQFSNFNREDHRAQVIRTNNWCGFNHAIGLPMRDNKQCPLHPFQQEIFDALCQYKDIWVKKARDIGMTELIIRFILWLSICYNQQYRGKRWHITTGPRIDIAEHIRVRTERIITGTFPELINSSKLYVLELAGGIVIQAFPSHVAVNTIRGYTEVAGIICDEADYFLNSQQDELRAAVEAYRNKSVPPPWIVLMSTPRAPGSLFEKIEFHEPDTPYHKIWLLYQKGLGTMFSQEQIERERRQPYFDREYCGIYTGGVGNVFSTESIDAATKIQYDPLSIIPKHRNGHRGSVWSSWVSVLHWSCLRGRIHDRPE